MSLPSILLLLLGLALTGTAAANSKIPGLEPIPNVDASSIEDADRWHIQNQRDLVDRLLSEGQSTTPGLPTAMADLGRLYLAQKLNEPAEACFENLRRLAPSDLRGPYLLGYLHHQEGRLEEALSFYGQALALESAFLPALIHQGRAHLTLGQHDLARASFEMALAGEASSAAAREGLGQVASAAGDDTTAARQFERALDLDPAATAIHYPLAQAYRRLGLAEKARSHFERAGSVAVRLDDPLIDPPASQTGSLQHHLLRGAEAMEARDYDIAVNAFRTALQLDPRNFSAYLGQAASLERLGDRLGARQILEQALTRGATGDPESDRGERSTVLRSLGLLEASAGHEATAQQHFITSLELQPAQPDLLLRVGNGLARAGRFAEAIERYDQLLKLEPDWSPAVFERRATALVNLGRRDEAIASFSKAVEAAPEDAPLRLRFAAALDYLGDSAAATAQRNAAAELSPASATPLATVYQEGRRLAAAGDLTAAIERYGQALELDPDHLESRFGLAEVLGQLGRFDAAVSEFNRVIDGASTYLPAHRGRLVALVLADRFDEARAELQATLRAFPRQLAFALTQIRLLALAPDPEVRDPTLALDLARRLATESSTPAASATLAIAYAAAGDLDRAVAIQRKLVTVTERDGNNPRAAEYRAKLTLLQSGDLAAAMTREEILLPLAKSQPQ